MQAPTGPRRHCSTATFMLSVLPRQKVQSKITSASQAYDPFRHLTPPSLKDDSAKYERTLHRVLTRETTHHEKPDPPERQTALGRWRPSPAWLEMFPGRGSQWPVPSLRGLCWELPGRTLAEERPPWSPHVRLRSERAEVVTGPHAQSGKGDFLSSTNLLPRAGSATDPTFTPLERPR